MIEIQDIKATNKGEIINTLLKEKTEQIDIYFPKHTVLFSSSYQDIAEDYAKLAYVGHRLSLVATKVSYEVVHPHEHHSVLFKIIPNNHDLLSEVLLELSYLYGNLIEANGEEYSYSDTVYQYIHEVESGGYIPSCPEFVQIYQQYVGEINIDD